MTTATPSNLPPAAEGLPLHCVNHPETETYLRCNRCSQPICLRCAVRTEVGYRCKACVRSQQAIFYNALAADNWIAFGLAALVTLIAWPLVAWLATQAGGWQWTGLFTGACSLAGLALAWGLQRTSGAGASLMLTLEALFTAMLAWRVGATLHRPLAGERTPALEAEVFSLAPGKLLFRSCVPAHIATTEANG